MQAAHSRLCLLALPLLRGPVQRLRGQHCSWHCCWRCKHARPGHHCHQQLQLQQHLVRGSLLCSGQVQQGPLQLLPRSRQPVSGCPCALASGAQACQSPRLLRAAGQCPASKELPAHSMRHSLTFMCGTRAWHTVRQTSASARLQRRVSTSQALCRPDSADLRQHAAAATHMPCWHCR